ncbi:MAG TPA: copper-binding protein [Candidatus Kapabacteria bacterium]|nr:copper-binding protein [Candidatus Kapabacteria bacterium]
MKLILRIVFILHTSCCILLLAGCSKLVPDVGTGTGRGIVRRLDFEHHEVTLSHGTVPHLLHPMTYAYVVSNDSIMRTVREGDTVSFTIEESHPGTFRVLSMKPIHPTPRPSVF